MFASILATILGEDEGRDMGFYDRYKNIERIGTGSFCQVYKCKNKLSNNVFAVKIFESNEDEGSLISREISILRELKEAPHVPHFVGAFFQEGQTFVVMTLIEGRELFDVLVESGPLPENRARNIFRQLCKTVFCAHTLGIAHRDIKPENIKLIEGEAWLLDWGFAFMWRKTKERQCCGSAQYASPEQLTGTYRGPEVDVWSLGVTLYVILEGRWPFHAEDISAIFSRIKSIDYTPTKKSSPGAKDLISSIFVEANKRPTLGQICIHEWMTDDSVSDQPKVVLSQPNVNKDVAE